MRLPLAAAVLAVTLLALPPASAAGPGDQAASFLVAPGMPSQGTFLVDRPAEVALVLTVDVGVATELLITVEGACLARLPVLPSPAPTTVTFNCGYLYLRAYEVTIESTGPVSGSVVWDLLE